MDTGKAAINSIAQFFTSGDHDCFKQARDVVWYGKDSSSHKKERFGSSRHRVMDDWQLENKPRFVETVLEMILLAQEAIEEE